MDIADKIYKEASRLSEHLAKEVLDFIEYIEKKHGLQDKEIQNMKEARIPVQPPRNRQASYLRTREILKKCSGSLADDIVADRDDRV